MMRANDAIATIVTPAGIFTAMSLCMYLNFFILTTKEIQGVILTMCVLADVLIFYLMFYTFHLVGFMCADSEDVLRGMAQGKYGPVSKHRSLQIKACQPLRLYVGPFTYVTPALGLEMGLIQVEKTIDAVITFG